MKKQIQAIPAVLLVMAGIMMADMHEAIANWPIDRDMNPLHMVVVFTKFKGEAPDDNLAPAWADNIFSGQPGSVPHFFEKVSFGIYRITGEYLPKRYELPEPASAYVQNRDKYSRDVLTLLDNDPTVDFSKFDNNGPDGIPGSADDDHYVDYMILMPRTRPYDFIQKYATGVWTLGLINDFYTKNKSSDGFIIKLDKFSGCIATANTQNDAVGTIVAEIAHAYGSGALDLMDKVWDESDPATESAGVGFWDFLGMGALGWDYQNGPMGPCAFNRLRMDSIGPHNTNLVTLSGFQENVVIKDVGQLDGKTYMIPISSVEYFLIEFRRAEGLYYDRHIPEDGILIWHVLYGETNNSELKKLCDLESPDGRYLDAGYPLGQKPDPIRGGDNLDFWSRNDLYSAMHAGNAGDAFDVYNGRRYDRFRADQFGTDTNPNSYSKVTNQKTGIEIFNIRAMGDSMMFDCIIPPFHNWFEEKYPFIGTAYHRFAQTGVGGRAKAADTGVYLVRTGNNKRPSMIITITEDEMKAESLSMIAGYEIEGLIMERLLNSGERLRDSRIERRDVSNEDFALVLGGFGSGLTEAGGGIVPSLVQKVTAVSSDTYRPRVIQLMQNYPNPFNAATTITYTLPAQDKVHLEVYNVLGQRIMTLDQGYRNMGVHTVYLNAGDLASGVYLYRLKGSMTSDTKRFTLLR